MIILNEFETDSIFKIKKIYRNNVFAGIVNSDSILHNKASKRKILFSLNEENRANDLLFNSPHYKINMNQQISIHDVIELKSLLEFFNFDKVVDDKNIKKIYDFFLWKNSDFLKKNYSHLPIKYEGYSILKSIAQESGYPLLKEKLMYPEYSFEPKVKIKSKKI